MSKNLPTIRTIPTPWKIVSLFIILAIGGIVYQTQFRSQKAYSTVQIDTGTITQQVTASGNVAAASTAELFAPATGIITAMHAVNGQLVQPGDILASITSTATPQQQQAAFATYKSAQVARQTAQQNQIKYQKQLEDARLAVLSAQTAVDQLNDDLIAHRGNSQTGRGYTQLEKDGITGQLDANQTSFSFYETQYLDASTAIQAARAAEQSAYQAYQNLIDQDIVAPAAGQIVNVNLQAGDRVEVESSTKAEPLFVLTDFSKIKINVMVSERYISQIQLQQTADITFEAVPGLTLTGQVTSIDTVGQPNNGLVTYNVIITLDETHPDVRPGMSADVVITTKTVENTTRVPNSALQTTDQGSALAIPSTGRNYQLIPIQTGLKDSQYTQITGDLPPGTSVISDPVD